MRRLLVAGFVTLLVSATVLALPLGAHAAPIYVSTVGSDTAGSGSLANPFKTVQHAVNVAVSGDTVRVGAGTFSGSINMKNGVSLEATGAGTGIFYTELTTPTNFSPVVTATSIGSATFISGFKIDGASSGLGISCSHSSLTIRDDWVTGNVTGIGCFDSSSPTISNCDITANTGDGIVCNASSPTILSNDIRQNHSYGILCTATASPSITGNNVGGNWSFGIECAAASSPGIVGNNIGGNSLGVDCIGSSSPSITDNDISGNNIAGIKCNNSSPSIVNNTILDGVQDGITCYDGSSPNIIGSTISGNDIGIYCSYSSPIISNCTIVGTGPTSSGTGIHCYYGAPSIANCTISGSSHNIMCDNAPSSLTISNCTIDDGWFGIDVSECSPSVTNCTISGNTEGIYCETASPTITNCTISGNSSGIGWYTYTASSPTITNCILWNPGATEIEVGSATYSDVLGGAPGTGNISADPSFVDSATGDFHLRVVSPCINAGTPAGAPATDRDGTHRPLGGAWDIGAYEYHPSTVQLHYTAGAGGTLSGVTSQTVSWGTSGTAVAAAPGVGYHFVEWSDHSTANPRTDTNVTSDATFAATFAINTYRIHYAAANSGGSIVGSATQVLVHGSDATTVTAVPDTASHYHFVSWSAGGITPERRDINVIADATYTANFALDTLTIAVAPCVDGTITPGGDQLVEWGTSKTFTITPYTGHHILDVIKDGSSVGATSSVSFGNVTTEGHTLSAMFAVNTYTLRYASGTGGMLSGVTSQTVEYNGSGTPVTAVPDTGYKFVSWSDGVMANPRTDSAVAADTSASAEFTRVIKVALIYRTPAKAKLTYTRKRGVAKFTLSAVIKGWGGMGVTGQYVYLQSSKNGRSWSNSYKLKTSSKGKASKALKITTKRVRYYRWYVPAKPQICLKTYSKSTKVTVK